MFSWYFSDDNINTNPSNRDSERGFTRGMVFGTRWACLGISETADLLGVFPTQPPLRFTENGQKKRQKSSEWQLSGFKCLVSDVRAEWLVWGDRKAQVTHITCYYNQLRFAEEHLWKHNILEADGLQCSHPLMDASSSIMNPVTKLTWSHTGFFNMTISSLYSSFLHSYLIPGGDCWHVAVLNAQGGPNQYCCT